MVTPIPNSFNEAKAVRTGPVKEYTLSPLELEEICKKYPSVKRGNDQMLNLTKEEYLNERKAGKSRNKIVKDQNISPPTLYKALEEWGIKDMAVEQEVLAALNLVPAAVKGRADSNEKNEVQAEPGPDELQPNDQIAALKDEIDRLTADNKKLIFEAAEKEREIEEAVKRGNGWKDLANDRLKDYLQLRDGLLPKEKVSTAATVNPYPFPTITLTYALIDFSTDATAQRLKVLEEANEVVTELEMANFDLTRTASELYDAGQAFVGLIRKHFQDLLVDDFDGGVRNYFVKHNQRHLEKMAAKIAIIDSVQESA